ncbi:hypothetical protein [Scytonema millei]|uniref:Uncharacterized protein n=1 Tax=Scytonema millei VB511283 TaxID=1245923 RepID=A0A9X5EA82_9CYAN|nr:hypothetical protein [Scytonema millei]NHC37793.1 hypothetical protein [Scytonema millei VB511283]
MDRDVHSYQLSVISCRSRGGFSKQIHGLSHHLRSKSAHRAIGVSYQRSLTYTSSTIKQVGSTETILLI